MVCGGVRRNTAAPDSAANAAAYVSAYGNEAVAAAIPLPGMRAAIGPDGVVGFVDVTGARVVAGSPMPGPPEATEDLPPLAPGPRNVVRFGRELRDDESVPEAAYVVGEQPWWNLARWDDTIRSTPSLRSQIRRAARKGVRIRECDAADLGEGTALRRTVEALIDDWMRARHMPPLAFVARVDPLRLLGFRRVFVAELDAALIGVCFAFPLDHRRAWLIDHVLRARAAPNGTAEALVDVAMRALAASGAERATLGLCPLAGRVPPALWLVRHVSRGLFDFRGLYEFKAKLQPTHWQRVLVEHPRQSAPMATLRALRAFAGGSLSRFAAGAALRAPPALLRLVAALLCLWIAVLALPAASGYFPHEWQRRAWIGFDVIVATALFRLAAQAARRRPAPVLHRVLAVFVTLDAVITSAQAVAWNAGRVDSLMSALLVAVACAAPWTVAVVLWSSLRFR